MKQVIRHMLLSWAVTPAQAFQMCKAPFEYVYGR